MTLFYLFIYFALSWNDWPCEVVGVNASIPNFQKLFCTRWDLQCAEEISCCDVRSLEQPSRCAKPVLTAADSKAQQQSAGKNPDDYRFFLMCYKAWVSAERSDLISKAKERKKKRKKQRRKGRKKETKKERRDLSCSDITKYYPSQCCAIDV